MYENEYEKQKLHLNSLKMSWEEAAEKSVFEWRTEEEQRTYYGCKAVDDAAGKEKGFGTPSKNARCTASPIPSWVARLPLVAVLRGEEAGAGAGLKAASATSTRRRRAFQAGAANPHRRREDRAPSAARPELARASCQTLRSICEDAEVHPVRARRVRIQ